MAKSDFTASQVFDEKNIWKILLKIAPPVMLAQLIQAMYNIVDSFFVGQYSGDGLTALSVIYPVQLIITAIAVGTGVGVNTQMSRDYAAGKNQRADRAAGTGTVLAVISWALFALFSMLIMEPYVKISVDSPEAFDYAMDYGVIVCVGSIFMFLESNWSKVYQASGNMKRPMVAQVSGALTNIILDPVLIFGIGPVPAMGISGAAYATVAGQMVAALITVGGFRLPPPIKLFPAYAKRIYSLAYANIFMQMLFTVYILALNVILAGFSDEAVTVLGLYYKIQSFFFIPLYGLQTCIVPLVSYTNAKGDHKRCIKILVDSLIISGGFMAAGFLSFEFIPAPLLSIFHPAPDVYTIGVPAFRIIATSFFPAVISLMLPVFFQALGSSKPSVLLSVTRQLICLIPIFYLMSKIGLVYCWLAFPLSELITDAVSLVLLRHQMKQWKYYEKNEKDQRRVNMKLITAVIAKKDSDNVCRALTEGGFYFTKLASSGGFLSSGNTTVLIGTRDERVKDAMAVIRANCSKRVESVGTMIPTGRGPVAQQSEVQVGGATIFVTDVDEFEKI